MPGTTMPRSSRILTASAVAALVLVTAYSVALGGSSLLWFVWVVLGLVTVGVLTTQRR